ncbi:MAG: TolC family protein [Campylobacterales bacterium]
MRRWLLCSLLLLSSATSTELAWRTERDLLLMQQEKAAVLRGEESAWSWLSPLSLGLSLTESGVLGSYTTRGWAFSISVDQPLFKGGAIEATIKLGSLMKEGAKLSTMQERRALLLQAWQTLFALRKNDLAIAKTKLLLANARLDIEKKREQYLLGLLDISFLNQALMTKNSYEATLADQDRIKRELTAQFASLSSANPDTIKLPLFTLLPREQFLSQNLALKASRIEAMQKKESATIASSRYWPVLSLIGSYARQEYEDSRPLIVTPHENYSFGLRLSWPLEWTMSSHAEAARLDYQVALSREAIRQRDEELAWIKVQEGLEAIQKKIALVREDQAIYADLLEQTKAQYDAGRKIADDVTVMANSLESKKIEEQILSLEEQELLMGLYVRMANE